MFIVFEGGDGAGKSTQTRILADSLTATGHQVLTTRQPGGTELGQQIRALLLDPDGWVDPRAEALMYAADKAQHVAEVIQPALAEGQVVVCDRYVDSLIAYQGAGRVLSAEQVASLADWATGGLRPDLTILLDIDPQAALAAKDSGDRLESAGADFHGRVRAGFLELADQDPQRYLVLSARDSRQSIGQVIRRRVDELMSDGSGTLGSGDS